MSKYDITGVYKIENKEDGKIYIGQSIDIFGRFRTHIRNAWQAKPQSQIARAIKKYGPEAFIFSIEVRFDGTLAPKYLRYLLKSKEIELVKHYDSYNEGYNGDYGGNLGRIDPIEQILF